MPAKKMLKKIHRELAMFLFWSNAPVFAIFSGLRVSFSVCFYIKPPTVLLENLPELFLALANVINVKTCVVSTHQIQVQKTFLKSPYCKCTKKEKA